MLGKGIYVGLCEADDTLYGAVVLIGALACSGSRCNVSNVFQSLASALEGRCVLYFQDDILVVEVFLVEEENMGTALVL